MLHIDPINHPYPSSRALQYARRGMVATSQPLAAQAGLTILQRGGNAIDAAIATAACLTVVEPTANGIGSDMFAIGCVNGQMFGINASGPAPSSLSIDALKAAGYDAIPKQGWVPCAIPGTPAGWAELNQRYGKLSLAECLVPAIEYARHGYPISPSLGRGWQSAVRAFKDNSLVSREWMDVFAPNGHAPEIGAMWSSPAHADTLAEIGATYAESFYRGALAEKIANASAKHGGFITRDDLAAYQLEWVMPVSVNYHGYDVWEIPPNSQGIVALIALNILKDFKFTARDDADTLHKQFEAMKLAFAVGKEHITDYNHLRVPVDELLSETFADKLRAQIGDTALDPGPISGTPGGTVYLAAADGEGNMVSFIQSNYTGFGSGAVVEGIAMNNRVIDFSLDPSHANALAGRKRTYHTLMPGFLTRNGVPIGPFGVMGGYMQPQGHVQMVMNTVDFMLNPQAALDAPRWQWLKGKLFSVEDTFPRHLADALSRRGHGVQMTLDRGSFGRGQIIWRDAETGVLMGGCEPRTDSGIAAW